eukprot:645028-Amphidinium_carterae.1
MGRVAVAENQLLLPLHQLPSILLRPLPGRDGSVGNGLSSDQSPMNATFMSPVLILPMLIQSATKP